MRFRKNYYIKNSLIIFFFIFSIFSIVLLLCKRNIVNIDTDVNSYQYTSPKKIESNPITKPQHRHFSYKVKTGDSFANIFSNFDISHSHSIRCYSSLKSIGFKTLFPGDSIVFTKDTADKVISCSLLNRLEHWYSLHIRGDSLITEKKPVEITKHQCVVKGVIKTSLSEDMAKHGVGDALVFKLSDIFAWDINFFIDPHKGDHFEVLFEKKYREGHFIGYGSVLYAKYVNNNRTYQAILMKDSCSSHNYFDIDGNSLQKQFLKAPLSYRRISSKFSHRRKHPILGIFRPHYGIDYAAPMGTPVHSAADGRVIFAGYKGGYGKHIRISHGASYVTYYGHLNKIHKDIKRGGHVKQGQVIGTVGKTGLATGPHLDYRMKIGARFINPLSVSLPSKEGILPESRDAFEALKQQYLSMVNMRISNFGCFVVSITKPQRENIIESIQTYFPKIDDGNTSNS